MIIYQMLKTMTSENRLASCISISEKNSHLFQYINLNNSTSKTLTREEEQYRIMNQILSTKLLLKLGMIDDSINMYQYKLGAADE